ncbi:hypothetical protein LWH94_15855 [Marinobacter sp. G11]|nr:hypothetical protein [Marinobacter sp. G11]MCE0760666.1 hypothetical protein [Marinobacter sp. G11]
MSDSDGVALGSGFAVQSGTTAVPGAVVLSSVNIVSGGSVELVSAQIGE